VEVIGLKEIWLDVAARLRAHREAGRGHLLTEDVVRLETVLSLQHHGVSPDRLVAEYHAPDLAGGKIDLVVDPPAGCVIEFKYPRGSRTGVSPDTMTLGEMLRDVLRVATVPAEQRWVVQVVETRLARYLADVQRRYPIRWTVTPGEDLVLTPEALQALPPTASQAIGAAGRSGGVVTARCVVAEQVDQRLHLYAYSVGALPFTPALASPKPSAAARSGPAAEPSGGSIPAGARAEILDVIAAITTRSGRHTFALADVVGEMARRGTRYAESTVRTMVTSHMCAASMGAGSDPHADLERVGRGLYRLRDTREAGR
jgi:hypothetical protein